VQQDLQGTTLFFIAFTRFTAEERSWFLQRIPSFDGSDHRSESFIRPILPLCLPLVQAIGHRMAYEAAVAARLDPGPISLFEIGVVKNDASWHVENHLLT
jgi:hypothetical protein